MYGWQSFDEIVRGFASCLKGVKESSLRKEDALAELTVYGNVFVLVVSPPRRRRMISPRDLARLRERITTRLDAYLRRTLEAQLLHKFGYVIGAAVIKSEPAVRVERLVYGAIDEALAEAASAKDRMLQEKARELKAILQRGQIFTTYHPILDLRSRTILGYEALSRGPPGSFEAPDVLFRMAYDTDLIWQLERVCRSRAMRALRRLDADQLLFINTEPLAVLDPELLGAMRDSTVERWAGRVVFEITERAAITDFTTFRQAVQLIKASVLKVAIDDVGAAYSGLRVMAEVEPDFVKLDMNLTRDAHNSLVKSQLIKAIARFCEEARLPLVVEGVESEEELAVLTNLGVHLVQGFLFARPAKSPGQGTVRFPEIAGFG